MNEFLITIALAIIIPFPRSSLRLQFFREHGWAPEFPSILIFSHIIREISPVTQARRELIFSHHFFFQIHYFSLTRFLLYFVVVVAVGGDVERERVEKFVWFLWTPCRNIQTLSLTIRIAMRTIRSIFFPLWKMKERKKM